jgi:hypothetical protein
MVMHVRMRQRLMLMLTLAGLAGRVLPLLAVLYFAPEQATLVFAITSALFYFSIVVVFMTIAGVTVAALTRLVATELALWGGSVTAAFIVLRVIEYA